MAAFRIKAEPGSDPSTDPDSASASVTAERLQELYSSSDRFETRLQVAIENGMFEHQSVAKLEDILPLLAKAMAVSLATDVLPADYSDAVAKLDTAKGKFAQALVAVGTWKRLQYVYGLPALFYLLFVLILDGLVVLKYATAYPGITFLTIPIHVLVAGSVGSVLQGFVGLWRHVDRLEYRKVWSTWYLVNPFVGALFGGVIYLAFDIGIVVTAPSGTSITNPTLPILLSAVAGYNWEWSRDVLNKVVQVFSPTSTQESTKGASSGTSMKKTSQKKPPNPKQPLGQPNQA